MGLRNNIFFILFLMLLRCAAGMNLLFSCDFGINTNETLCGMMQSTEDDFDWKLTSTSDKTNTGPTKDHTGNAGGIGRFLWSDSGDGRPGQKATIVTPLVNLTGYQGLITFWYHLYGNGRLEISVCQAGDTILTLDGDQDNQWYEQNLTASCGDNKLQVEFTSTISSELSDAGVDDLHIYDIPLTTTDGRTTELTSVPVTPNALATTEDLSTSRSSARTSDWLTTPTDQTAQSSTNITPFPRKGPSPVLPVSLSVAVILSVAAVVLLVCVIRKRRQMPEKPIAQDSIHRYDNHAYSTGIDGLQSNTSDTRRNTDSTFDSSTWRSVASTLNDTQVNDTQTSNQAAGTSRSTVPGVGTDTENRHYFVLNPNRASMLVENGENGEVSNPYDPVALYDNKPERYTYIDNDGSSVAMETRDAAEMGMDDNGYDPVTVKDDITGGYQYVDDTGLAVVNGASSNHGDLSSPYEPVTVGEVSNGSKKTQLSERKTPIPAARKNIPPKPKERMVNNVLYKPMNGEIRVDNVLYNPIQGDK